MTYLSRPPRRGPTPDLCAGHQQPEKRPEIVRVEYTVFTKADVGLTWKIFSDWKLWPSFSDVYGKGGIEWRGAPWEPGSRLLSSSSICALSRCEESSWGPFQIRAH